jgi:hypothetical protein
MNLIVPYMKWNNMLDLQAIDPTINKENPPLVLDPRSKRSTPQLNQVHSKTKRGLWIDEALEVAMDVIERGTHSLGGPKSHGTSQ